MKPIQNMQRKRWLALYTRPRFEKKIQKVLVEQNIECYLPMIKTLRQWSDRRKWVEVPLFSSYIFVKVSHLEYLSVLNAPGSVKFVSFEGNAVEIPEKQIEAIKWVLSTNIETEPLEEKIPEGSKVEVIKGPLMGLIAEMTRYNNKNIIMLRIEQLDKSIEVKIPRNHVRIL